MRQHSSAPSSGRADAGAVALELPARCADDPRPAADAPGRLPTRRRSRSPNATSAAWRCRPPRSRLQPGLVDVVRGGVDVVRLAGRRGPRGRNEAALEVPRHAATERRARVGGTSSSSAEHVGDEPGHDQQQPARAGRARRRAPRAAGGRPSATATASRRQAARPCERSAQVPSGQVTISSTIVCEHADRPAATWMTTNSSASGQSRRRQEDHVIKATAAAADSVRSQRERPASYAEAPASGTVEAHAGQPVQPDELDQRADLRLGAAEQDRAAMRAQAAREHRQIEHQRRVGEHELAEVDDDVGLGADRPRQACRRRPGWSGPRRRGTEESQACHRSRRSQKPIEIRPTAAARPRARTFVHSSRWLPLKM